MSSEIIQGVAYYNYDDFQHLNFMFPYNGLLTQVVKLVSW
jgi:hypothetical protein